MNWEALGSIAELVAAIAVLVTLIFLSIQVRTSNELTKRANRDKTIDQFYAWRQMIGASHEVASVWLRGCRGDELNAVETVQFQELAKALFLIYAAWGLRAQENDQPAISELASNSLVEELKGENKSKLRDLWFELSVSDSNFNALVKQKLSSMAN